MKNKKPSVGDFIRALHELARKRELGEVDDDHLEKWQRDVKAMEDAVVDMHKNYLPKLEPTLDWAWKRRYIHIYGHLQNKPDTTP